MKGWTPAQIANAARAQLISADADTGPERVVIDSRAASPGALFVGLEGGHLDGGRFAGDALAAGAWGVLVAADHALLASEGVVLASEDPLKSLQSLATAWRRALGAQVIAVTGSTGKTSTKDLIGALLSSQRRTVTSPANLNTEIGLPLAILGAPAATEILVLEMGMRGRGQIAELAAIAEPDVGIIVNIGPAHLEILGSIENIAAAKAELIAALTPGGAAIVPSDEPLLDPHLRPEIRTLTFGTEGDVRFRSQHRSAVVIEVSGDVIELDVSFSQAHLRTDLLAAVAAAHLVGVRPEGHIDVVFSAGRGQAMRRADDVVVIDSCYNANPMSMAAALADLRGLTPGPGGRRIAVLGDMLELGPQERAFHAGLGDRVAAAGVDMLVTVGPRAAVIAERFPGKTHVAADAAEAASLVPQLISPGDVILVKASRGVGLEQVCRALGVAGPDVAMGARGAGS